MEKKLFQRAQTKAQRWTPRLRQYAVSCRAFFDRNYNLLFNGKNCIKIKFYEEWFKYNEMVAEGTNNLRCLGKGWYVRHGS
jgi:hypothetical protein